MKKGNLKGRHCYYLKVKFLVGKRYIKDTHREKAPSNKTPALKKSRNMGIIGSLVHQSNSL